MGVCLVCWFVGWLFFSFLHFIIIVFCHIHFIGVLFLLFGSRTFGIQKNDHHNGPFFFEENVLVVLLYVVQPTFDHRALEFSPVLITIAHIPIHISIFGPVRSESVSPHTGAIIRNFIRRSEVVSSSMMYTKNLEAYLCFFL